MRQARSPAAQFWFVPSPIRDHLRPYRQILARIRRERPSLHALARGRSCFSQFGEDQFLAQRFAGRPKGFYVDIGAFDPFQWSNTCLLYHRGWRGINVEPDPDAIERFVRHRPHDINVQIAISSTPGEASFLRSAEFAGIESDHYLWAEREAERIIVRTQPLAALLEERLPPGQEIDLLDVDCEGHDLDVLQSNDWSRFRPTIVLAEAHNAGASATLTAYMESVGYRSVTRFDLTLVFEAVPANA